jgi:hypothetical protein
MWRRETRPGRLAERTKATVFESYWRDLRPRGASGSDASAAAMEGITVRWAMRPGS